MLRVKNAECEFFVPFSLVSIEFIVRESRSSRVSDFNFEYIDANGKTCSGCNERVSVRRSVGCSPFSETRSTWAVCQSANSI